MTYVELHAHSAFSFLDGASLPDELVPTAIALGYGAMALTDHNSVSGSMEFAVSARALGLRPIHGAEIDLADGRHLTLLVIDSRGWSNLCRILTRAHAYTREGRPGAPASDPSVPLEVVLSHTEGLICLSGCSLRGVWDEPGLRRLLEAFGPDRLRIELQRPFLADDRARNRRLSGLARRLGVPSVATGNVHAHIRARAPLQDAFVAVRTHTTLDSSEPLRRGNFSHVLASPEEMERRFAEYPEAVAETAALAERLRFDLGNDLGYRYPGAEDDAAMRTLTELCDALIDDRYRDTPVEIRSRAGGRLQEELRIIDKLGLPGFFLLHHDMLVLAREVAVEVRGPGSARALLPPGRGRGSSVSSIVCFLTGLSHVDPIANELLIGRFLNEELTSLPDIDLDFPRDIREKLIPRVHERYGHDRSALVAAFPTFRARGAIRELGKVLGLPAGEIERVARGSEGWSARDVGSDIVGAGRPELTGRWAWLARLAEQAHGLPRHLSQHSGGMIVATRPLVDCCPIVPAAMEGRQIAMWDKDSCADAGFLKIDLLGLGMLSAVERAVAMISELRGERIDLSRIPYDDPATYEVIQNADTTGVFQIESRAQMASLRRTRPETLQDITIQVAIVRPGPIQGGAVNPYIARKQRLRIDPDFQIPYEHPVLEEVLSETLGTIIFQDQVLEVSIAFAGFSIGEAEGLRRAMSRKRSDAAIEAYHERFVAGAQRLHGVDGETAERVFEMVKGFSGFGFPKAHGAAFGLLAYQSTWLRVHYAPEFLCALLNEQPMGFYPPDALVHEAQRGGMEVLAPDVNESGVECDVVLEPSPRVRIGLGYVRGARREELEQLVDARERGGRFRSLSDLASRAGSGADALSLLAWSGACDALALSGVGIAASGAGAGAAAGAVGAAAGAGAAGAPPAAAPAPAAAATGQLVAKERIDAHFDQSSVAAGTGGAASRGLANNSHISQVTGQPRAVSGSRHAATTTTAIATATAATTAANVASRDRGSARRIALWQLGVMTPGRRVPGGTQLALPLDLPAPPSLRQLSEWERMLADYDTIGLTTRTHPMALLRERLGPKVVSSADLERLEHGRRVRIGGLVVARQRPGTASGVVFILLEDEYGTINLVVPPPVYERHRLTVRTEPLMLVGGKLEKLPAAGGAINVLVDTVGSIDAPDRVLAEIKDFSMLDEQVRRGLAEQKAAAGAGNGHGEEAADGVVEDFRAVAPPVMSFASGRRR